MQKSPEIGQGCSCLGHETVAATEKKDISFSPIQSYNMNNDSIENIQTVSIMILQCILSLKVLKLIQ